MMFRGVILLLTMTRECHRYQNHLSLKMHIIMIFMCDVFRQCIFLIFANGIQ